WWAARLAIRTFSSSCSAHRTPSWPSTSSATTSARRSSRRSRGSRGRPPVNTRMRFATRSSAAWPPSAVSTNFARLRSRSSPNEHLNMLAHVDRGRVLDRVRPADFFGEMSLLDGSPRSATVQAETDAMLLSLDRTGLQRLSDTNPRAAAAFFYAMVHVFIERLRRSTHQVAEATRWGLEATGLDVESR